MAQPFERQTVSFVLRLWSEPGQAPGETQWRGQIEHVGSGDAAHFVVPAPLLALFATHFPASSAPGVKTETMTILPQHAS